MSWAFWLKVIVWGKLRRSIVPFTAARFETQQAIETILQKHAMPFANGVVIQKQGLGNFLATPAGVEKHQRIGPPYQPVLHRTIPRQGDQVGAVLRRQKSSAHHATDKNRKITQWQEIFRTFNDSGYNMG
jgi:hypothetical protein